MHIISIHVWTVSFQNWIKDLNQCSELQHIYAFGPLHSHSNVSIFIFQMKMFEAVRPLQTEIDQMRLRNKTLEDQTKSFSKEVLELQEVWYATFN